MRVVLAFLLMHVALSFALPHKKASSSQFVSSFAPGSSEKTNGLRMSDAVIQAGETKPRGGDASIASSTFNLAKSIVGCGVLSLPSGIAYFSDHKMAVVPASIICILMGVMAAYTFSLIGRTCDKYGATSFQEAWAKSVDEKSAWTMSASITAMCFLASLAYSIIIGDSFTALADTFKFPGLLAQRNSIILLISGCILFPLCSLNSLAALSPFSLLGLGGTVYTAIFMGIRLLDGTYGAVGKFTETLPAAMKPVFGTQGPWKFNNNMWNLVSMLSTSYIAHYNAPKFFAELQDNTMTRFNKMIGLSFTISVTMFILMMSMGFLTFGGSTLGFVLNNYAGSDLLATAARLAIGTALITGYPFTFCAMRDGLLDIAKVAESKRKDIKLPLNVALMTAVTALALVLKDVGFVVSLSGALFGSTLMFVVPAFMNISNLKKGGALTKNNKIEIAINYIMMLLGLGSAALGMGIAILGQMR
jgi:sodium-coupled neutral amino acid transporter 11